MTKVNFIKILLLYLMLTGSARAETSHYFYYIYVGYIENESVAVITGLQSFEYWSDEVKKHKSRQDLTFWADEFNMEYGKDIKPLYKYINFPQGEGDSSREIIEAERQREIAFWKRKGRKIIYLDY